MMRSRTWKIFFAILVPLAAVLLYACAHTPSLPARHPVEGDNLDACGACHADWRASLNHGGDFSTRHKFYAWQQQRTCNLCHSESFCSDCHAHKEEIKPSDKYQEQVTREFPHRGNYIAQHQIDGRIYPTWCVTCHGRQNNERCRICHRS